jgi:type I restriction enzyme S subunit
MAEWPRLTVQALQDSSLLLVEDGNHGEYRPRREEFSSVGTAFIRATDMAHGQILFDTASKISESGLRRIRKGIGQPWDVLLSHKGTVGKVARTGRSCPPFVCSPQTTFYRSLRHEVIDPRFLFYDLQSPSFQRQLLSRKGETDMADYVSLTEQRRLVIDVPPIVEQRAIAEVLGALDEKIECNNRLHDCSHNLAAALLARVLGETEAEGTQSEGRLEDIAAVNVRKVEPAEGTLRYLDISSVGVGRADEPTLMPWTEAPGRARRGVRNGDVLWSSVRPNRKSHCLVLDPPPDLVVSTGFAVLTPTKVGSSFLYGITEQPAFIGYLEAVAEGSTYPAVRADRFLDAPVRLVPTGVLASYEEETMPLRRRATTALDESRVLAQLRDTLLPRLLSGELRVRDAEAAVEAVA